MTRTSARRRSRPSPTRSARARGAACTDPHEGGARARATPTPRSCSSARGRASTRTARAGRSSAAPAACSCGCSRRVGWRREDVFITNVVKCRPPDNRDPQPDEIAACAPYLRRQLEVLDPAVVVTLGRYSMGHVPARARGSARSTGRRSRSIPRPGAADALVFAMYHPAAALRSPGVERESFEDMRGVRGRARCARARAREGGDRRAADGRHGSRCQRRHAAPVPERRSRPAHRRPSPTPRARGRRRLPAHPVLIPKRADHGYHPNA